MLTNPKPVLTNLYQVLPILFQYFRLDPKNLFFSILQFFFLAPLASTHFAATAPRQVRARRPRRAMLQRLRPQIAHLPNEQGSDRARGRRQTLLHERLRVERAPPLLAHAPLPPQPRECPSRPPESEGEAATARPQISTFQPQATRVGSLELE